MFSVFHQHDSIIVRTDINHRHLIKAALGYCGAGLSLHKLSGLFAQFQNVNAGTHHAEAAEFELFLAPSGEFRGFVKYRFPGNLPVLNLQVFDVTDYIATLVHVKQHGVTAVLLHVHARGQHAASVTVQAVV